MAGQGRAWEGSGGQGRGWDEMGWRKARRAPACFVFVLNNSVGARVVKEVGEASPPPPLIERGTFRAHGIPVRSRSTTRMHFSEKHFWEA